MRARIVAFGLVAATSLGLLAAPAGAEVLPELNPGCDVKIEQSFRLSEDVDCPGSGWHIDRSGLTIDLNGHTLRGDRGNGDVGILLQEAITLNPADNVTIRNGTVRGFDIGINIGSNIKGTTIDGIVAVDNVDDGIDVSGPKSVVRNSFFVANDEDGIVVSGQEGNGNAILKNRVANNGRLGIFVITNDNVVRKNVVASNGESGIHVSGDRNVLERNNISGNGHGVIDPGLNVLGKRNEVTKNVIVGNGDDGYRDSGIKNVASKNAAIGNGFFQTNGNNAGTGVDVSGATKPSGSGNRSIGNDAGTQCTKASMCAKPKGDPDLPKRTPDCDELITKSFRLGADMDCDGNGLRIGAANITIDLAGRTIRGDADNADRGILNDDGHQDVTIRNGVVRRFGTGIQLNGAEGNLVAGVIAVDNTFAGFTIGGVANNVVKSTSVANGLAGFSVVGPANIIDRVRASNNVTSGVAFGALADGSVVKRSTVTQNLTIGIEVLLGADQSRVSSNTIAGNGTLAGHDGIDSNALGTDVIANTSFGNTGTGYIDTGGVPLIEDNVFNANGYIDGVADDIGLGLDASGTAFPEGSGNVARGNDDPAECDAPQGVCT